MSAGPIKIKGGRKIGLFGGSFNPAHSGHKLVAQCGLREAGLDEVWWLVSPGNPLKASTNNYEQRLASVHALNLPRQMKPVALEQKFGTRYTIDMIRKTQERWPRDKFVWMMGADNLGQLPRWKNWTQIMESIPILIIARPGQSLKARLGHAARRYANHRLPERQSHILAERPTPCWTYVTPPLNSLSSTKLREKSTRNIAPKSP